MTKELRLRGGRFKILHLSDLEYTNGADTPCIDPPGSSMFGWLVKQRARDHSGLTSNK